MFICGRCKRVTAPGEPQKKVATYRANGSILKEVPLCRKCAKSVEAPRPTIRYVSNRNSRKNVKE